ncbi:MAG: response regulator [Chromatiales bacterium]|nr:response regulator [Chromatiales bacterium]
MVEDNEKDIKLFESITKGFFNEMIIARNGEEAIELLQNKPNTIDIIILDLLLPGMSGYTVCKMVKNNFHTRNIQALMVTCLTDLETKIKGIEEGVDDYLVKPVDSREIKSRVNALLKKKKYLDHLTRYYESSFGLAARDEITGFYNQAYLTSFLKAEIEYSKIYDYSFGLIILEINNNHEKNLNYAWRNNLEGS